GVMQQYKSSGVASDVNFGAGYRTESWGIDASTYHDPFNGEACFSFSLLYFPRDWIVVKKLDLDKPQIMLEKALESISLEDNIVTYDDKIEVYGKAKPGVDVYINGARVAIMPDNTFKTIVPLKLQKNLIIVEARYEGEKKVWKYKVLRKAKVKIADEAKVKDLGKKKESVEELVTMGVIEITPEANFVMEAGITRGELASWLVKAADMKLPEVPKDLFADVPKNHPLAPYIKVVVDLKLLQPFPDGTFRPDAVVSKSEGEAIFKKFGMVK
ncbi:MAG: S-layer homology domain-containing protein, partial [Candidatus Margulisbacteria bacterium]|nr:S-layer homology domain-containing protein [Candidatus Margulisiibacteriota bacterium]